MGSDREPDNRWGQASGSPDGPSWPASPANSGWDPLAPGNQPQGGAPQYGQGPPPYSPYQRLPSYPTYPSQGYPGQQGMGFVGNYKGSRLGLPQFGPGSLAGQWRRLGARILDGLIVLPFAAVIFVPLVIHAVHTAEQYSSSSPMPSSVTTSLQLSFLAGSAGWIALEFLWEAIATSAWGRTPGKALLRMRPLQVVGSTVTPGRLPTPRCWGRAGAYFGIALAASFCGLIGLLDELWCLWDGDRQCLHDKLASTVVVND
jgi:uncharacterized RDD family membrane protein YckC